MITSGREHSGDILAREEGSIGSSYKNISQWLSTENCSSVLWILLCVKRLLWSPKAFIYLNFRCRQIQYPGTLKCLSASYEVDVKELICFGGGGWEELHRCKASCLLYSCTMWLQEAGRWDNYKHVAKRWYMEQKHHSSSVRVAPASCDHLMWRLDRSSVVL